MAILKAVEVTVIVFDVCTSQFLNYLNMVFLPSVSEHVCGGAPIFVLPTVPN